ncbi:hypothetical protein GOBAR_AA25471 [Gossypium barbadense]|uniref:Uncharacterized protein n=1 Tax=Gossypium barbadense TaxID=3634 RepID=A0A2P5WVT3_GOSBA|nr:hypothetical protein GOBAR_AA25471 [Gossypium barbadense]
MSEYNRESKQRFDLHSEGGARERRTGTAHRDCATREKPITDGTKQRIGTLLPSIYESFTIGTYRRERLDHRKFTDPLTKADTWIGATFTGMSREKHPNCLSDQNGCRWFSATKTIHVITKEEYSLSNSIVRTDTGASIPVSTRKTLSTHSVLELTTATVLKIRRRGVYLLCFFRSDFEGRNEKAERGTYCQREPIHNGNHGSQLNAVFKE